MKFGATVVKDELKILKEGDRYVFEKEGANFIAVDIDSLRTFYLHKLQFMCLTLKHVNFYS